MNTPNPYIESVVKEWHERICFMSSMSDVEKWLRSKLTLALEEGKFQGMRENTDKVSEYSFAAGYEDGEAAGRKAAVEYIDNNSWEEIHSGQRYSVTEIETIKAALQASNG